MAEYPVINASPLIFLSRADLIDLLQLISEKIIVPEAVAAEIANRGTTDPTAKVIADTPWLLVTQTPPVPAQIRSWRLGDGESSVLAWAYAHPGTEAIVDDLLARRCAEVLNISVRGTLGLVLVAKRRERIASARSVLQQLRTGGMYLSDRVMNEALKLVGE